MPSRFAAIFDQPSSGVSVPRAGPAKIIGMVMVYLKRNLKGKWRLGGERSGGERVRETEIIWKISPGFERNV